MLMCFIPGGFLLARIFFNSNHYKLRVGVCQLKIELYCGVLCCVLHWFRDGFLSVPVGRFGLRGATILILSWASHDTVKNGVTKSGLVKGCTLSVWEFTQRGTTQKSAGG